MVCPKLAEGDVVRITRVDQCGRPVSGPDNAVVSSCWASVLMAPNVSTGTDIEMPGMNGQSCAFKRACPDFRGFDNTGNFWEASPEQIELLTGNPVVLDFNGDPVGWSDEQVACATGFALEIWQQVLGQECTGEEEGQWFYWLEPWLTNGLLGDVTVGPTGLQFSLTAASRKDSQWGVGPWDVQAADAINTPGPLLTSIGANQHRRAFLTTIAPPTAQCGYIAVPELESVSV